jgi:hypothetical protein
VALKVIINVLGNGAPSARTVQATPECHRTASRARAHSTLEVELLLHMNLHEHFSCDMLSPEAYSCLTSKLVSNVLEHLRSLPRDERFSAYSYEEVFEAEVC